MEQDFALGLEEASCILGNHSQSSKKSSLASHGARVQRFEKLCSFGRLCSSSGKITTNSGSSKGLDIKHLLKLGEMLAVRHRRWHDDDLFSVQKLWGHTESKRLGT